jgi:hypothetical protein
VYRGQQELIVLSFQNKTILTSVRFAVNNPSAIGTEQGAGEGRKNRIGRKDGRGARREGRKRWWNLMSNHPEFWFGPGGFTACGR